MLWGLLNGHWSINILFLPRKIDIITTSNLYIKLSKIRSIRLPLFIYAQLLNNYTSLANELHYLHNVLQIKTWYFELAIHSRGLCIHQLFFIGKKNLSKSHVLIERRVIRFYPWFVVIFTQYSASRIFIFDLKY